MNIAEWILVVILSCTLLAFLILGIILIAKLIGITNEAKKIIIKGQDIAENANGIVTNVKGLTSVGGVVQTFADRYIDKAKAATKEAAKSATEKVMKATKAETKEPKATSTKTK